MLKKSLQQNSGGNNTTRKLGQDGGFFMYEMILFVHSWLRWAVTFFLLIVFLKSLSGWLKRTHFLKSDKIFGGILVGFTHLQLVVGLTLYFGLSPITNSAMNNMGFAMKNVTLRFWGVEHLAMMLLFVILIQTGRTLSKHAHNDLKKHKRMAIFTGIALVVLIAGMPWPNRKEIGRPLFMELPKKVTENLNQ